MGEIRTEVWENHLRNHPDEENFLKPFLNGFYVTWGAQRKAFNTILSTYLLNPEDYIKEIYGFNHEILLVYSPYERFEKRTIQASESFFNDVPVKGRAETLNYFLVSKDPQIKETLKDNIDSNSESRIIIAFTYQELLNSKGNTHFIRNSLDEQFFSRDLFDYKLPLVKDTYFFGRSIFIIDYYDAISRKENKGIFGLRKTGKTSVLYKLKRMVEKEDLGVFIIYDCKSPSIRKLRWFELLEKLIKDIAQTININLPDQDYTEKNVADLFIDLLKKVNNKEITIAFDEIDFISYNAIQDKHWKSDYIDFWQTIWSCQSMIRKFSFIISGVNPIVVEEDLVNGIQNPLFAIVSYKYLTGFSFDEMKEMVKKLGKRMGLNFEHEALEYLHKSYGGHPLLTRLAISYENSLHRNEKKPYTFTKTGLIQSAEKRDVELEFYCNHVISELQQFYPDEYMLIEFLSCNLIKDFLELSDDKTFVKHLESYGLLTYENKVPKIAIPVIGKHIAAQLARKENRKTILLIVNESDRKNWLSRRISSIISDLNYLEKQIGDQKLPSLFGPNSFPEMHKFMDISVCKNEKDFTAFTNTMSKCFVESIELYGKSLNEQKYLFSTISDTYPDLFESIYRIKLYRHSSDHLALDKRSLKMYDEYLQKDLETRQIKDVPDAYFILQQCTIDAMLNSIQIETCKLT